jgi:hypothetical protein
MDDVTGAELQRGWRKDLYERLLAEELEYELDSADFDYTIRSVRNIISDRNSVLCLKRESAAIRNPEHVDDIMDNVAYYTNLENRYLWQFAYGDFRELSKELSQPNT